LNEFFSLAHLYFSFDIETIHGVVLVEPRSSKDETVLAIQVKHMSEEIESEARLWVKRLHHDVGRRLVQSSINRSNVTAVFSWPVVDFETKFDGKLAIDVVDLGARVYEHRDITKIVRN